MEANGEPVPVPITLKNYKRNLKIHHRDTENTEKTG